MQQIFIQANVVRLIVIITRPNERLFRHTSVWMRKTNSPIADIQEFFFDRNNIG